MSDIELINDPRRSKSMIGSLATQPAPASKSLLIAALAVVYVVWGSTYFAIRLGLHGYPPIFLSSMRYLIGGLLLTGWLRLRGTPWPSRRQLLNAAILGTIMLSVSNGFVAMAERHIGSGLAATTLATVSLWSTLFGLHFGFRPSPLQWAGVALGLIGVILLNLGGELSGNIGSAVLLLLSALSWSFGVAFFKNTDMPAGLMNPAMQMLCAAAVSLTWSTVIGEQGSLIAPWPAVAAMLYLAIFGSVIAHSAYTYLMRYTTPAIATSNVYVNPVVAVSLGVLFGGETISSAEVAAIILVLGGVALIVAFNPGTLGADKAARSRG